MSIRCHFKKVINTLLLTSICLLSTSKADVVYVPEKELVMNKELQEDVRQTLRYLHYGHYRPSKLDDGFSARMLDQYLEMLDPYKAYFTKEDIHQFNQYRYKLDDLLKRNDAKIAFSIFKVYRKRLKQRTDMALELIDSEFDFTKKEVFNIDKDTIEWASAGEQMQQRWRKKIKNDTLVQIMSEASKDEIKENLKKRYLRQKDVAFQLKSDEVFESFMNAYARELEPHTQYMSHATAESFRINMSLSLEGIGAVLQAEDDYTKIQRVIPGGPAEQSGEIDADDKIVAVGQKGEEKINVIGWRLTDVVQMIRGDKGTQVTLDVIKHDQAPGSPPKVITLVRDVIKLEEQAAKLSQVDLNDNEGKSKTISIIRIPSFYSNAGIGKKEQEITTTTHDVRKLLGKLNQSDSSGLVIDLRGNGGGFLNEAISLSGLFIERGPIVQVVESSRKRKIYKDHDPSVAYSGPMVVLIDRYSASASEIFAGAMQDYGRALVIGERSFGKGTVQQVTSLRNEQSTEHMSQLKFTIAQFFRINGDSTQQKGIMPDIVLKSGALDEDFGERSNENALPWAKTKKADYQSSMFVGNMVTYLQERHAERSSVSSAFQLLRKSAQRVKKNKGIKQVSLNLEERRSDSERRKIESLDQLNQYRASLGLVAVTEESKKDNPLPDEDEHWNIVFQKEAARILLDQLKWHPTLFAEDKK